MIEPNETKKEFGIKKYGYTDTLCPDPQIGVNTHYKKPGFWSWVAAIIVYMIGLFLCDHFFGPKSFGPMFFGWLLRGIVKAEFGI